MEPPSLNIGLDVIPVAWTLFKQQPLLWLLNGLISTVVLVPYLIYVVRLELGVFQHFDLQNLDVEHMDQLSQASNAVALPITLVSVGVVTFLYFHMAGSYPLVRKQLRGEPVGLSDVLCFDGRLVQTLANAFLMSVLILGGYMLCYIPGPLMEGITIESPFRVIDLKEGPIQAISGSYRTVKGRVGAVSVVVHILTIILSLALTCGIGLLVGAPLYNISRSLLYHRLREAERLRFAASSGFPHPY